MIYLYIMKILFVACYTNNAHYMDYTKTTLERYLIDCEYEYICLNDAPDINSGEENYLNICDIITGENNCYENIKKTSEKHNFIHIKIPQNIHIQNRANHSSARHIENLNWFNKNLESLFPKFVEYDFICHIDSDAFFARPIALKIELQDYDLAGPYVHIAEGFYIHTGLFFINLKTVINRKEISWNNTMNTDTGSDIYNFIKKNPQYKIKKLGHYDGYSTHHYTPNNHTIFRLNISEIESSDYELIDKWFNESVVHFRGGSCFGVGSLKHRNNDRLYLYNIKWREFINLLK